MSSRYSIVEGILKGRFSMLLASVALLFFVVPLIPGDQVSLDRPAGIFSLVVLISCLRAISTTRRFFIFMLVLSLINVAIGSTEIISNNETDLFRAGGLVFKLIYFLLVFVSIMRYVLDDSAVSGDKICGALSAYLLMGITWSVVFMLFYHIDPTSFSVPEELLSTDTVNSIWTVYFSFTTLTTLGYGDITPQTPVVQSYAFMEAACGQIFLAVIIARLIALQIVHSKVSR
jgi:voltage-gated potassium channel